MARAVRELDADALERVLLWEFIRGAEFIAMKTNDHRPHARERKRIDEEFKIDDRLSKEESLDWMFEEVFERVFRACDDEQFELARRDATSDGGLRDVSFDAVMNSIEREVATKFERVNRRPMSLSRARDVKMKCSSCKHVLVKDVDFTPGKKTCNICLEKHRKYEQRKRTKKVETAKEAVHFSPVWNAMSSGNSYARAADVVRGSRREAAFGIR